MPVKYLFGTILVWLGTVVSLLASSAYAQGSGSFWVMYMGDAPTDCVKADGEMVDEACCKNNMTAPPFMIRPTFASTCFVISGLLGEDGGSLMSYLGCNNDTEPVYGESCYNNGVNGGLIFPNATVPDDRNTTTIDECGCTFQVVGNGCHKIRDFSTLPGFEMDQRQVFLYMEETCEDEETAMTAAPTANPTDMPSAGTGAIVPQIIMVSIVMIALLVI